MIYAPLTGAKMYHSGLEHVREINILQFFSIDVLLNHTRNEEIRRLSFFINQKSMSPQYLPEGCEVHVFTGVRKLWIIFVVFDLEITDQS